jgi:hypothetical protein
VDPVFPTGAEALDLEVVIELIELERVDSGFETTCLRTNPKRFRLVVRMLPDAEAAPHDLVDDLSETEVTLTSKLFESPAQVVVEGEGRSHTDIMMPELVDVKMPSS